MKEERKKVANVPNLRFKGFTDNWEYITLGKCSSSLDYGMNASAVKYDGKNRYIRITDIDENTSKYKSENHVSPEGELHDKYLVKENDILFTRTGASTGKTYCYDIQDGKLYFAGFLIRARINIIFFNAHFVFIQTQTAKYDKWVKLMSMRSGQPGINSQEYASYQFKIPSKIEQDKIALFFNKIDYRIQTQIKIIEDLKLLKKGISNRIFAKNLRFSNHNTNWKVIKLKEILSIPEKIKAPSVDKNKLLTVKLHLKGVLKNENSDSLLEGATNYFVRKKGQFIFGKQNLFNGAFGLIPDELDGFLSSGDLPTLDINYEKVNSDYLIHFLGRANFYKKLEDLASGSGSKRIHESTFLDSEIILPDLKEQKKIVAILNQIDNKTNNELKMFRLLNTQKQCLLQNLFT